MSGTSRSAIVPELLSARDAAAFLGIGERTLWKLANAGEIPAVRFGIGKRKSVRYRRGDLVDWIEKHSDETTGGRR